MRHSGKIGWFIAAVSVLAAVLITSAVGNALAKPRTVTYTVTSDKLSGGMRLALLSDLHGSRYGAEQRQLMAALQQQRPDAVLLCGDIFDSDSDYARSEAFLSQIAEAYPCYFVMGNHEYGTHRDEQIKELVRSLGITLLEGDCNVFTAGGTSVRIAGVDDVYHDKIAYAEQLDAVAATLRQASMYTVLLSHEPQFIDQMLGTGVDLILSGHTHGGQWSIPGVLNGLYAPGQGLFPKYAGGRYEFGAQTLVISRGLSKKPLLVPRIFTPRELVILELNPA